ncbi:efflux RND transporter periplasmic adaptor subunit [Exilibacterium tricleocarpae]|uniref:Efflux RND transporter periplasmic adaptor subunit n=1 Tax=Exilibacterium tricleocarpae TaxID=2591008 RepID=A0A545TLF1_9GAMM|nr:efflux RND transporter periplasmic adaptor subunit [Exilibacterium tricleocarpae]TQV78050.1 efflux RND transporter periplasmic adaptor subunit [Exilibacterium tricleocarpae]
MKYIAVFTSAVTLLACQPESPQHQFDTQQSIKVKTATLMPTTVTGKVNVFGVLESAEEVALNVEFSAPVEKVLVDEGQAVIDGQPLLIFDDSKLQLSLQQTQHMLEQALTQQENARLNFSRLQTLLANNTVSQQQFDEARFARDVADAKTRELKASLQLIERDLGNTTLTSPIDAVVGERRVEAGQSVTAYQPLLTLQAVKSVKVSVFVGEHHLPYLRVGNRGWVKTVAGTLESEIYSISATADARTGNFEVKLLLDNTHGRLKPGMTANVTLLSVPIPEQLIIPEAALVAWQGQHVVYVAENDRARRQPVEVMLGFEDHLYVRRGLAAGDQLIVIGARQVTEGSLLEINHE